MLTHLYVFRDPDGRVLNDLIIQVDGPRWYGTPRIVWYHPMLSDNAYEVEILRDEAAEFLMIWADLIRRGYSLTRTFSDPGRLFLSNDKVEKTTRRYALR